MSRLVVKNFSCIEEADIEISNLTVVIGAQASGKSVLAKLAYFFHEFVYGLFSQIWILEMQYILEKSRIFTEDYKFNNIQKFHGRFPQKAWGHHQFNIIYYFNKDEFIEIDRNNQSILMNYSEGIADVFEKLDQYLKALADDSAENPANSRLQLQKYMTEKAKIFGVGYSNFALFIPAGRSFFSNLKMSFELLKQSESLDPHLKEFADLYSAAMIKDAASNDIEINLEHDLLLKASVVKDGAVITLNQDGRMIPLSYASSGQQELFPMLLVLDNYLRDEKARHFCVVEEPEAHLFPETQSHIIRYIVSLIQNTQSGDSNKIFITTHSPYILSQLNILLKAGKLADMPELAGKHDDIKAVVEEAFWLRKGAAHIYGIDVEGVVKPLIDAESGMIDDAYLDAISDTIANDLHALLDIEFADA